MGLELAVEVRQGTLDADGRGRSPAEEEEDEAEEMGLT